ncbi:hypothetical protein JCM15415_00490 [Methanobacterium movens]
MVQKILVLKNQGSLELESQSWMELKIFNYQRITIDNNHTYLLKKAGEDSFYSLQEMLGEVDGVMIFVLNSPAEVIRDMVEILKGENIPYVLLMEEPHLEISKREGEVFQVDKKVESVILAFNRLSHLIEKKDQLSDLKNQKIKIQQLESHARQKKEYGKNEIPPKKPQSHEKNHLKKVKFNLDPGLMGEVKDCLDKSGFSNITVTELKQSQSIPVKEIYRGNEIYRKRINQRARLEVMMVIKEEEVEFLLNSLIPIKDPELGNSLVISKLEDIIRISSQERGLNAVD